MDTSIQAAHGAMSRREFLRQGAGAAAVLLAGGAVLAGCARATGPVRGSFSVSIVRIRGNDTKDAVEEALRLLGGLDAAAPGKGRIMLKPNLVGEGPGSATKVAVVEALAAALLKSGREVLIGEGSTAAQGYNAQTPTIFRTQKPPVLDRMQAFVFDRLGYTEMARRLKIPLVNLHTGDMATVRVPDACVYDELRIHHSLTEVDLLCSVPMMKTHDLASVSLALKNLLGCYPGSVYSSARGGVHDAAWAKGSPGVAYETVDMARANKLGLTLVDASWAMEGNGPVAGKLLPMGLIVAGANALAVDMVGARLMGFEPSEVPTLSCAWQRGLGPSRLEEIEIRGVPLARAARRFQRPRLWPWGQINRKWGVEEVRARPGPRGETECPVTGVG